MKKNIIKSLYYSTWIAVVIFAILSVYGIFSMCSVPVHPNNTTEQYVLFPTVASLKYVFVVITVILIATCLIVHNKLVRGEILTKPLGLLLKEKLTPVNLFTILSLVITSLSLIFTVAHKEIIWDYFLPRIESPQYDAFMDFFNHISYVRDPATVYYDMTHACFPPLAYVFYYGLSILLPTDATAVHLAWNTQYYAQIVYIVYVVLCVLTLVFLMRAVLNHLKTSKFVTVSVCILVSNVFVFEVLERGNSVLIVAILLLLALILKDSKNAFCRELALICIAVATGFKIYPAIFGILYLMEKRFWEALRLTVYGIVLFFAPFVSFGGVGGMLQFLSNQMAVQSLPYDSLYSVVSSVRYFAQKYTGDPLSYDKLAVVLQLLFIAVNFIAILNNKLRPWEKIMILCAIIAFAPSWSGGYTSIFFVIPLVMLLAENNSNKNEVSSMYKVYTMASVICFALLFALNMFVLSSGFALKTVSCLPMYAIDAFIIVRAASCYIASIRRKIKKQAI